MTVKCGQTSLMYPLFLQRCLLPVCVISACWDFAGTGRNCCTSALEGMSHQCNTGTDCSVSPSTVLLYGNMLLDAAFRGLKFALYGRGDSGTLAVKNKTALPQHDYFLSAASVVLRFSLGMSHFQKVWSIKSCPEFYDSW